MITVPTTRDALLLRHGRMLEALTLSWNVIGIVVLAVAALAAHSLALAGFGLDSLIETGASAIVLWELSGTGEARQRHALRLIAAAFVALARSDHSPRVLHRLATRDERHDSRQAGLRRLINRPR